MTNPEQSVIDAIDALVDEQMAGGEPIMSTAARPHSYDRCKLCDGAWHGEPWRGVDLDHLGEYDQHQHGRAIDCPGAYATGPQRIRFRHSRRQPRLGIKPGAPWIGPPAPDLRGWQLAGRASPESGPTFRMYDSDFREVHVGAFGGARFAFTIGTSQRRWWRMPLASLDEITHHNGIIRLASGQRAWTFEGNLARLSGNSIDVLTSFAPEVGGTWEPITAPGVVEHPDDEHLMQRAMRLIENMAHAMSPISPSEIRDTVRSWLPGDPPTTVREVQR